ncbi:MAG: YceI family protein [Bacteroidia bacterium]
MQRLSVLGLILIFFLSWNHPQGEDLPTTFITRNGNISFTSDAPLELIKAESKKLYGIIDLSKNKLAFSVSMNSFQGFQGRLQKEHFQEKFLETTRYPKGVFNGKLISKTPITTFGTYPVRAKGTLDIHGVKKDRIIYGNLVVDKTGIHLSSSFTISIQEHGITVPTIVNQKIASEIDIEIDAQLTPKE